jgi:hypothetical protein
MRVFVSYSHDSTSHTQRVLALADRLRTDGIDVRLDQYTSNPPEGWPRWMQNQLRESDFTLLVCTPTYRRRFDGDENPDTGKGATWEGMIAQQILYDASALNRKLIPVIFEDGEYEDIPLTLRPFTHHRLPVGYDDLYRHLTGQPKTPPPPLGSIRTMPPAPRGGQQIDNRGANIGQMINLTGTANLGPITFPPPTPTRTVRQSAKILLLTANATHPENHLRLEEELRTIVDSLARARAREHFTWRISPAVTFSRVVHDLDDENPTIVHFSGHGNHEGGIVLRSDQGHENPVAPELIAGAFAGLRAPPRLVVFATCNSAELARLTSTHVAHAIGFVGEVEDATARKFSEVFYERLASREDFDVPFAFDRAKLATLGSGYGDAEFARLFP